MSKWLAALRERRERELNESNNQIAGEAINAADQAALPPPAEAVPANKLFDSFNSHRPETPLSDPEALFSLLCENGPMSYGAAASTLGWGVTRAWQADEELRRSGRAKPDHFGRMVIIKETDA